MRRLILFSTLLFAFLVLALPCAEAKRIPPPSVEAVTSGTVRYAAAGDGRDEFIVARDVSTGTELWRIKVAHNHSKFWIEACVQAAYIDRLALNGDSLEVGDERGRCFAVNLKTRRIHKLKCTAQANSAGR